MTGSGGRSPFQTGAWVLLVNRLYQVRRHQMSIYLSRLYIVVAE
jgi:hypothetical protein